MSTADPEIGLELCPFCGGVAMPLCHRLGALWFVLCLRCAAQGPERHAMKDALDCWNRRTSEYEGRISNG